MPTTSRANNKLPELSVPPEVIVEETKDNSISDCCGGMVIVQTLPLVEESLTATGIGSIEGRKIKLLESKLITDSEKVNVQTVVSAFEVKLNKRGATVSIYNVVSMPVALVLMLVVAGINRRERIRAIG